MEKTDTMELSVKIVKKYGRYFSLDELPVDDNSEAEHIANSVKKKADSSGSLTLSFEKGGERYT